jgi:hypothetical protein
MNDTLFQKGQYTDTARDQHGFLSLRFVFRDSAYLRGSSNRGDEYSARWRVSLQEQTDTKHEGRTTGR